MARMLVETGPASWKPTPFRARFSVWERTHFLPSTVQAFQSMDDRNNKAFKELGIFYLKKKIEDVVVRAEMIAPMALESEEEKLIKQEEALRRCNLWDDITKSNESLVALSNAIKVVNALKDLRYKAEEAKLVTQLAEMDVINHQLFKQAYNACLDVSKFLDRYEMSKLLIGPYDKEGACVIIQPESEGINSEIWAEKLLRMYIKWAKNQGFKGRVVEKCNSKEGGIKSATIEFESEYAYGYLSGERGGHRMIRSSLDSSIIRETCLAGVDVTPLFLEPIADLHIDDKDLEISYLSLHKDEKFVCITEAAVGIHHIPTGFTVQCSGERSPFANKVKALSRLKAKLLVVAWEHGICDVNMIERDTVVNVGKQEIRRYVFRPQKSVQDLKTGVQLPDLNSVLEGNIEPFIRANISLRQAKDLA